jgi:hypothetical protein
MLAEGSRLFVWRLPARQKARGANRGFNVAREVFERHRGDT